MDVRFSISHNLVRICAVWTVSLLTVIAPRHAYAQLPPPDNQKLFQSDTDADKAAKNEKIDAAIETHKDDVISDDLDIKAPKMEFLKDKNEAYTEGGVVISRGGTQIQGDSAHIDLNENHATVKGNVVLSTTEGVMTSEEADLFMDSETGTFKNAEFTIEAGGYEVETGLLQKMTEFEFQIDDSKMSTCHCFDNEKPWYLNTGHCNVTQEGYAHCYDTSFHFQGLPVFYTPWIAFPVKSERASGLLAAEYGGSNRNGFRYMQPLYLVLDDSSDLTIAPFIETRSRVGSSTTYRQVFSNRSNLDTRLIYSNESRRGSDLRGLQPGTVFDPQIDTNRFGGYYKQLWRPDPQEEIPFEFLADGHYVSDSLFLREIQDGNIGAYNSQYLVSTAVLRGTMFDNVGIETRGEYNQVFNTDQDLVFQRAPDIYLTGRETLRPFGYNPYGAKLVLGMNVQSTDFLRSTGYDGWRTVIRPSMTLPFHYQNYFQGQFGVEVRRNEYRLRETFDPTRVAAPVAEQNLEDSQGKTFSLFRYTMQTGVERVYELEKGNWFSRLMALGARNENEELVRLKHTIEPVLDYMYVPGTATGDMPLFDGTYDRLQERSLITYGVRSRVYGKFQTPLTKTREIGELTPAEANLPSLDISKALQEFGSGRDFLAPKNLGSRASDRREIMSFGLRQNYNYAVDHQSFACGDNETPEACAARVAADKAVRAFSDLTGDMTVSPSSYTAFQFGGNYNAEDSEFTGYSVAVGFRDDRDDLFRIRYNFVDDRPGADPISQVSQIEGNLELALNDRLRVGYYGRYDETGRSFLESRGMLRYISSCKCWNVDFGLGQTANPDKQSVLLSFTFSGLGDISQDFGVLRTPNSTDGTTP